MTNCVPAAQMLRLLLAPVVEPPENSCRMNRVLLDLLAAARNGNSNLQRKTILGSVFVNTNVVSQARLGIAKNSTQFWSIVPRWRSTDFTNKMRVYDVVPRSNAAKKGCRVIRTRWVSVNKGSDDAPQLRARWVLDRSSAGSCGDKHEYFSETPHLALVKAVIAHASRRAESEDIVVAVF